VRQGPRRGARRWGRTECVEACAASQRAIWVEGHRVHCTAVTLLLQQTGARRGVPQPPGLVKACCGLHDQHHSLVSDPRHVENRGTGDTEVSVRRPWLWRLTT